MKTIPVLFIFLFLNSILIAQVIDQDELELQQKYFNLQDHFHKVHVMVGSRYKNTDFADQNKEKEYRVGTSIPYEKHNPQSRFPWTCRSMGEPGNYSTSLTTLFTGDGTIKIGWYLVYLATEYKLLHDAGKDTKETVPRLNQRNMFCKIIFSLTSFSKSYC